MFNWLFNYWQRLNRSTIGTKAYWGIALQNRSALLDTLPVIEKHIRGRTLDIGAGDLAWKSLLVKHCSRYIGSDVARVNKDLDVVFDVTRPFPFRDGSFDSLFCQSVLEHTAEPWRAFAELRRVLSDTGEIVLSVPFLFYLHGAPHDYFRFTRFGVRRLAEDNGLAVEYLKGTSGIFHFLLNIPSIVISSALFFLRVPFLIPLFSRLFSFVARFCDSKVDPQGLFSMNILVVLRKAQNRKA